MLLINIPRNTYRLFWKDSDDIVSKVFSQESFKLIEHVNHFLHKLRKPNNSNVGILKVIIFSTPQPIGFN